MPDGSRMPLRVVSAGPSGDGEAPPSERTTPLPGPRFDLDIVVAGLRASRDVTHNIRRGGRVRPPPSPRVLGDVVDELTAALFPSHHGPGHLGAAEFDPFVRGTLNSALCLLEEEIRRCSRFVKDHASDEEREAEALAVVRAFSASLPAVRGALVADLRAARERDPDVSSAELLLADAGLSAMVAHRLAHVLHGLGASLAARLMAAATRRRTGVDIHPAAEIGPGLSVGIGASVGGGAVLGARVRLGPGAVLGFAPDAAGAPGGQRGPVIGDDVAVGPGAAVLGAVTVGAGAVIGAGACVTENVPAGTRVVQAPNRRGPDAV